MRDPARKALYCFLGLLAAAGLIRFGALRLERAAQDGLGAGSVMLGFAILPFPLYFLIQALFAIRGRGLLLAGRGVIARWRVAPADWQRFRGLDSRRAGEDLSLGNDLWIRGGAPAEPVEVIVGEKSALVDGSYHPLRPGGIPALRGVSWVEGSPACLEFSLLYPRGRYGGKVPSALRLPVPASARAEAARVFEHYSSLTAPALRSPRNAIRDRAGLILLAAAAAAGLLAVGKAVREGHGQIVLMTALIFAAVLGAFALAGLAAFLLARRA